MQTTTIRISTGIHARLQELSRRTHQPMTNLIAALLDEHERTDFWRRYAAEAAGGEPGSEVVDATEAAVTEAAVTERWQALPDGLTDDLPYPLEGLRDADTGELIA